MRESPRDKALRELLNACRQYARPPRDLTVDEWADAYRVLDGGISAEAGNWRTDRTPYMREPMRAFTDPTVEEITVCSPSQVGKSEFELNCIGYIIDQDPSTILYVHPTKQDAEEFSRLRLEPCIKASPTLRDKFKDIKQLGRTAGATVLMKAFPGGMLNFAGSNSSSGLSSKPIRFLIGDELDRWAPSAGKDGDPWELAKKRQITFFNRKRVAVSTPTVKGQSRIEKLYYRGTQERWKTQCPRCGSFHEIKFDDIRFKAEPKKERKRISWDISVEGWRCPTCHSLIDEHTAKRQPSEWFPDAPENLASNRARSFWLNGFVSPWSDWKRIIADFLEVKDDPERLQVWKNTTLGELWERRAADFEETALMERAETYPPAADLPANIPGRAYPLLLTCGVDCQHAYLQYEVVGWSRFGESWGIRTGFIQGSPDSDAAWEQLDSVISRAYRFPDGKELRVTATFVDSGDGNFTNEIARRCSDRTYAGVYACKGDGTTGRPFVSPPRQLPIGENAKEKYWLYVLGVNAGKSAIMASVAVQSPGPNYMHFPDDEERGYDLRFYSGLLSEVEEVKGVTVRWVKLPGHERNEALDCRNYARAAYKAINPDFDALEAALSPQHSTPSPRPQPPKPKKKLSRFL